MPHNRRSFDRAKSRFKKTWARVQDGLGRNVVVYLEPIASECPNCYYDKVNRVSSGICKHAPGYPTYFAVGRCPVCRGKGVLTSVRRRCIKGIVTWNPSGSAMNSLTHTDAGFEGATRVEIKTDPCNLELLRDCQYIVVDGIQCKLSNPPIMRGIGEQQILIAQFFAVDKPKSDSGEII
jgi:hypothetical protein